MLTETAARWLLVLHTLVGVAAVGAATHLVIWMRRYFRGAGGTRRAVLKFARLSLALQVAAFVAGNVMYPTYRVEVRAAYLENPTALIEAQHAKAGWAARVMTSEGGQAREASATASVVRRGSQAARWFDVKEHWVALGIFVAAAQLLMWSRWPPGREPKAFAPVAMGFALVSAATLWLAATIGILTSAWRAI